MFVAVFAVVISVCLWTGKVPNRATGLDSRADSPVTFWAMIGLFGCGVVFGALMVLGVLR